MTEPTGQPESAMNRFPLSGTQQWLCGADLGDEAGAFGRLFTSEMAVRRRSSVAGTVFAKQGDGLYLIGFDYHVGFLVIEGGEARLCHAAWYGPAVRRMK